MKICKCHLILKYGIRLLLAGGYIFCNIRSLYRIKLQSKNQVFVGHSHSSRSSPRLFRTLPFLPFFALCLSLPHPPLSFLYLFLFKKQPSSPHSNIALLGKSAHTFRPRVFSLLFRWSQIFFLYHHLSPPSKPPPVRGLAHAFCIKFLHSN